jgi:hypothetical protein
MSTPRKIDAKTAAKRRAARRRQTRETLGRIGTIVIVAILVLGTVASVILPSTVTAPGATPTDVPAIAPTVTQGNVSGLQEMVTRADQLALAGNWADASSLYRAYLSQNATDGEVHFKLGKVYLSMQPPDYLSGLAELQQALNINPGAPYAQEAQSLIDQNNDKALTPGPITGTVTTLPGTMTATTIVTGTSVTGTVPATTSPAGATQTP